MILLPTSKNLGDIFFSSRAYIEHLMFNKERNHFFEITMIKRHLTEFLKFMMTTLRIIFIAYIITNTLLPYYILPFFLA